MSLSEYSKNFEYKEVTKVNEQKFEQSKAQNEEYLRQKYESLKGKNHDELMGDLFKEVSRQKQNGSFDYESLESSVEAMKPFLSAEQQANIKELLEKIK